MKRQTKGSNFVDDEDEKKGNDDTKTNENRVNVCVLTCSWEMTVMLMLLHLVVACGGVGEPFFCRVASCMQMDISLIWRHLSIGHHLNSTNLASLYSKASELSFGSHSKFHSPPPSSHSSTTHVYFLFEHQMAVNFARHFGSGWVA